MSLSFFSRALSLLLGKSKTVHRRDIEDDSSEDEAEDDGDTTPPGSEPATPNSWIAYQDAYGRPCWRNNMTRQWTYNLHHAHHQRLPQIVSQPAQVWPAPPLPGLHQAQAPWNGMVPAPPAVPMFPVVVSSNTKKKKGKNEEGGYWETVYDSDGEKSWRHTKTKKVTHRDPYY